MGSQGFLSHGQEGAEVTAMALRGHTHMHGAELVLRRQSGALPCPHHLHLCQAQGIIPTTVQMSRLVAVLRAHRTPGTVPTAQALCRVAAIVHWGAEMPRAA